MKPVFLLTCFFLLLLKSPSTMPVAAEEVVQLPKLAKELEQPVEADWLVVPTKRQAGLYRTQNPDEIVIANGLISRTFRLKPNGATVGYDNLMTGASILRGVKPEAVIELDGAKYEVGGLQGQVEYAYLRPEWVDSMTANPEAFRFVGFRVGKIKARFPWKRKRYSADLPWPPRGVELTMEYRPPQTAKNTHQNVTASVHYEIYDGIPLMSKWITIRNGGSHPVILNTFISEILAAVEYQVPEELSPPDPWLPPNMHVESDYAFLSNGQITTHWVPDPQYTTQLHFNNQTPNLLECRLPLGPDVRIAAGETFESFRTYELIYDTTERERQSLALRRMYRTVAPWCTENPIFMHVRSADSASVRKAIDQCAEVGFEMVIMTFGSGLNMENENPAYLAQVKADVDYAHSKGVELGGYSLLASRSIGPTIDVVTPDRTTLDAAIHGDYRTERFLKFWLAGPQGPTQDAVFGASPCLCSTWGDDYFRRLKDFIETTGLDVLEHDGSYPGDVCASTEHTEHRGLKDSQWKQWKKITEFYHWCRKRGVYINDPDWYFLSGANKTCMTYKEVNCSLPRERQVILFRQNIFDGTWSKPPSMGWMFLPLVEYQGGGPAATIEPLREHLGVYEWNLAQNFGSGVQACYRGPRLYDCEQTKAAVKAWVDFYKRYRPILDSDIIHVRRPDGRDIDCILHVNPQLKQKGLAMVYNPTPRRIREELKLPLYYTGLTETAMIRREGGKATKYTLDRQYNVKIPIDMPPDSYTWLVIE